MKILPNYNNVNFSAKINRPTLIMGDQLSFNPTKEKVVKYYDNQINTLLRKRNEYLELDNFMYSSDVQKAVAKLPKDDSINIKKHCYQDDSLKIFYDTQNDKRFEYLLNINKKYGKNCSIMEMNPFNNNGELDKAGIMTWLDNLSEIISHNK